VVSAAVEAKMRKQLESGDITVAKLKGLKKKELPSRFGGRETTCWSAAPQDFANRD